MVCFDLRPLARLGRALVLLASAALPGLAVAAPKLDATGLRYAEYGAPGEWVEDLTVSFADKRVDVACYRHWHDWERKKAALAGSHVCTAAEWTNVVKWIDGAAIGKWKPRYENKNIIDGTLWQLELLKGTNVVARHSGANAWPQRFWSFRKFKKFALAGAKKPTQQ